MIPTKPGAPRALQLIALALGGLHRMPNIHRENAPPVPRRPSGVLSAKREAYKRRNIRLNPRGTR